MTMLGERFFLLTPTATGKVASHPLNPKHLMPVYLDASATEMLWGTTEFPLPKVGQRIFVTMNGIGNAKVVGFFDSPGSKDGTDRFVGVLAKPTKPPAYYRENIREAKRNPNAPQWQKEGIGCFFAPEIEPEPRINPIKHDKP